MHPNGLRSTQLVEVCKSPILRNWTRAWRHLGTTPKTSYEAIANRVAITCCLASEWIVQAPKVMSGTWREIWTRIRFIFCDEVRGEASSAPARAVKLVEVTGGRNTKQVSIFLTSTLNECLASPFDRCALQLFYICNSLAAVITAYFLLHQQIGIFWLADRTFLMITVFGISLFISAWIRFGRWKRSPTYPQFSKQIFKRKLIKKSCSYIRGKLLRGIY